jgi:hypothetical protein
MAKQQTTNNDKTTPHHCQQHQHNYQQQHHHRTTTLPTTSITNNNNNNTLPSTTQHNRYSLGIILFEMSTSFGSGAERIGMLTALREKGVYSSALPEAWLNGDEWKTHRLVVAWQVDNTIVTAPHHRTTVLCY